jgi:hypothetical protein
MNPVRRWNLFLRAVILAVGVLILGVGAFRAGVIEDPHLALWPTFGLLHLDEIQGPLPLSRLALVSAVQVTIWTFLAFLLFYGFDAIRHGSRRS